MADLLHPASRPDFHLCLDSADLDALRTCLACIALGCIPAAAGMLRRAGLRQADLSRLVETLLGWRVRQVQVQVSCAQTDEMLREADGLIALADPGQLVVKIPATREGLAAGAELAVQAAPSGAQKCERCWHWRDDVGHDAAHPTLCGRCTSNLYGEGEQRRVA